MDNYLSLRGGPMYSSGDDEACLASLAESKRAESRRVCLALRVKAGNPVSQAMKAKVWFDSRLTGLLRSPDDYIGIARNDRKNL